MPFVKLGFKHKDIFASKKTENNALVLLPFDHFPIPYNTLCLPPKFCINHCFQNSPGTLYIPKSI